jgi:hypothetical protein
MVSRLAASPDNESAAPGTMFIPSDLPVEPVEVPVDVVLEPVAVVAPVALLVEDCCVAAGAIYTSNDLGQSFCIYSVMWVQYTALSNLPKSQRRSVQMACPDQHIWHFVQQY